MKARVLLVPLAGLLAALILWLGIVSAGRADEPPVTTSTDTRTVEVEVNARVQGKTVAEWHAVAARYLHRVRDLRRRIHYVIHSSALGGHWLERAFLCIHTGEGSWSSSTNPIYDGGLQMDLSFQRTYGDWALRAFGTADRWPASVQVATAIRAYTSGRGFYPWPNTARACGLIR